MNKLKVYIAGPLNAGAIDYIKNLHKMCQLSERVRSLGCAVYVPGLDFLMGFMFGDWRYEDYFSNSQPWLAAADVIVFGDGWSMSEGCKKEHKLALELDKPICYGLEDFRSWIRGKWSQEKS